MVNVRWRLLRRDVRVLSHVFFRDCSAQFSEQAVRYARLVYFAGKAVD
jgi:hypothetical protein